MVKKEHIGGAYNHRAVLAIPAFIGCLLIAAWLYFGTGGRKKISDKITQTSVGASTMVTVRVFNQMGQLTDPITMPMVVHTDEEWKKLLTADQFHVARNSGTEPPFCGNLLDNKKEGVYTCICCNLPLFASNAKFNSGTGWPSFFQPICKENVTEYEDNSHGMTRVEITCTRCNAHLGHVFDDGPREKTGLRFCLNSESLDFTEQTSLAKLAEPVAKK